MMKQMIATMPCREVSLMLAAPSDTLSFPQSGRPTISVAIATDVAFTRKADASMVSIASIAISTMKRERGKTRRRINLSFIRWMMEWMGLPWLMVRPCQCLRRRTLDLQCFFRRWTSPFLRLPAHSMAILASLPLSSPLTLLGQMRRPGRPAQEEVWPRTSGFRPQPACRSSLLHPVHFHRLFRTRRASLPHHLQLTTSAANCLAGQARLC